MWASVSGRVFGVHAQTPEADLHEVGMHHPRFNRERRVRRRFSVDRVAQIVSSLTVSGDPPLYDSLLYFI